MANNNSNNTPESLIADDFFEQILAIPSNFTGNDHGSSSSGGLQLVSSTGDISGGIPGGVGGGDYPGSLFPLGLSLEQGRNDNVGVTVGVGYMKGDEGGSSSSSIGMGMSKRFHDDGGGNVSRVVSGNNNNNNNNSLFPTFGQQHVHQHPQQNQVHPVRSNAHLIHHQQPYHGQPVSEGIGVMPHPPSVRPRVRARRGQATDPHSIAERLRRERIAERMKALQELVPSSNKTDRAAMLDEIVAYVEFLRLQVKVLSMSRLGGSGAVAALVADIPHSSEGDGNEGGGNNQAAWEKWSADGTEQEVAKLMEEDVGAAMQYLQSKALCIMPLPLANVIYNTYQPSDAPSFFKPEPNTPS